MTTTQEVFINNTDSTEYGAGQALTVSSGPTAVPNPSDIPHDLRFGAVVRHFRLARNMTQLELSQAMGHSSPEWAGMCEASQRRVSLDEIPQLAGVLQLSAAELGKMAVREYLPKLAAALFGDPSSEGELPKPAIGHSADLLPAGAALARAWQGLTPKRRQIVTSMVQALQETSGSDRGSEGKKKRSRRKANAQANVVGEA